MHKLNQKLNLSFNQLRYLTVKLQFSNTFYYRLTVYLKIIP